MNEYIDVLVGCSLALTLLWVLLGVEAAALNWQLCHSENGEIPENPPLTYFIFLAPFLLYRLLKTRRPILKHKIKE